MFLIENNKFLIENITYLIDLLMFLDSNTTIYILKNRLIYLSRH